MLTSCCGPELNRTETGVQSVVPCNGRRAHRLGQLQFMHVQQRTEARPSCTSCVLIQAESR